MCSLLPRPRTRCSGPHITSRHHQMAFIAASGSVAPQSEARRARALFLHLSFLLSIKTAFGGGQLHFWVWLGSEHTHDVNWFKPCASQTVTTANLLIQQPWLMDLWLISFTWSQWILGKSSLLRPALRCEVQICREFFVQDFADNKESTFAVMWPSESVDDMPVWDFWMLIHGTAVIKVLVSKSVTARLQTPF